MIRRVSIEKLAPTGEGIARTAEGVGFVEGALAGEDVEAEVLEVRKTFWRGRAVAVLGASPERVCGPHAGCPGCDWAHFELAAARRAKRELFVETMERIGKLPREIFGELPVVPSPAGYRLRNRFHVAGSGEDVRIGYFARRSHAVEPIGACEMVTPETLEILPRLCRSIAASGAPVCEIATLETLDGGRRLARVRVEQTRKGFDLSGLATDLGEVFQGFRVLEPGGRILIERGQPRLWLSVEGRQFAVAVETFFQSNRYLVGELFCDVRALAQDLPPGLALDAFGGAGFFARAMLEAGHTVVSVEGNRGAVADALRTKERSEFADRWSLLHSAMLPYLARAEERFDLAVADPPRAGLGVRLAQALARRTKRKLVYVSCEPATLARDLPEILSEGFEISGARLYDLFASTHRVEAVVELSRGGRA